ncbi:MAG: hypothetical protein UHO61_02105 [Acutalibacteraceae bacterium]|nr:hypothetical protein [Acutalibacteraceae bacterium]
MMGYNLIKRAKNLLGYSGNEGDPDEGVGQANKGLEIINQLLLDLNCEGISSLSDIIAISPAKEEALCYGTAMLLALTEGDADRNRLFTEIYNAKRATALAKTEIVKDCLPKVTEG